MVFDREGYSPGLFKRLWQEHRVGCVSYHKHPSADWPESEFLEQHFTIDLLGEYKTQPLHDTESVINPVWRHRERQRNVLQSKLRYRRARFAEWTLHTIAASEPEKYEKREKQKALLLEEIQKLEADLQKVTLERKQTTHHILWKDLPEEDRFSQPVLGRKRLMDAVRMIAYRAETATCALITEPTLDTAAARRVLQYLFVSEADLRPDPATGMLHVEIHRSSRPAVDRILSDLMSKLNEMEFKFPGTDLQLHYQLVGDASAPNEEPASNTRSQR